MVIIGSMTAVATASYATFPLRLVKLLIECERAREGTEDEIICDDLESYLLFLVTIIIVSSITQ